jgi:hypothetical protein
MAAAPPSSRHRGEPPRQAIPISVLELRCPCHLCLSMQDRCGSLIIHRSTSPHRTTAVFRCTMPPLPLCHCRVSLVSSPCQVHSWHVGEPSGQDVLELQSPPACHRSHHIGLCMCALCARARPQCEWSRPSAVLHWALASQAGVLLQLGPVVG